MRVHPFFRLVPLLMAVMLHGMPSNAEDDGDGDGDQDSRLEAVQEAVERGEIKSLGALKNIVRTAYPGDIVHVSTHRDHGRFLYQFRVLEKGGRLIEIEMDAATGRILEAENEE